MGTEEWSLVVAAVAVVVGPFVAYRVADRGFTESRRLADRGFAETRALADRGDARNALTAGALELGRLKAAMKEAFTAFGNAASKGEWPEDFPDQLGRLQDATDDLEGALAGVRIRFSEEEPVVKELDSALKTSKALIVIYATTRIADLKGDNDWAGMPEKRADPYGDALTLSQLFDDQKKGFLAAAHKAAGAKLT